MKYYIVDAFADELFKGNPAGVCLLDHWIGEKLLQNIAMENNLAETAFLVKSGEDYDLRWFTPECEIDLCGHATLASAFVLMEVLRAGGERIVFRTQSGLLTVIKDGDRLLMDFPSRKPVPVKLPVGLEQALGAAVLEVWQSRDLVAVMESAEAVRKLDPDFERLKAYKDFFGIIATARGSDCDFVSRYFAPGAGIPEDPVTGSSHSTLIPFWSEHLHKTEMKARQLSRRGGSLYCRDCGDRVTIGGQAKLYLTGEIHMPGEG